MFGQHAIHGKRKVRRLSGVIEPRRSIRLRTAATKDQQVGTPASAFGLAKKTGDVMRPNRTFQAVQKEEPRCADGTVKSVKIDEIAVRCFPTLDPRR
jgi:hypothetical protein